MALFLFAENIVHNRRCSGGTDATRQWTPRVNGRHASMDASPVQAAHVYRAWLSSKKLISRGGGSE